MLVNCPKLAVGITRYGDHPAIKKTIHREDWLEKIRSSIKVFSIPTNRLKNEDEYLDHRINSASKNSLMISALADEIQQKIQVAIRTQFEEGRKRETSFPARLMQSLSQEFEAAPESVIESIQKVQKFEQRYKKLGLLPAQTGTTEQLQFSSINKAGMLVLKTYLEDIQEKFYLLDFFSQQLDIFCNSINDLMAFKYIETSSDEGIIIRGSDNVKNDTLSLSNLSSGEQHLIVLIGKLVFNTDKNSLVLIDEPEISFHPEWQEKFLDIIDKISKLNSFTVIVATHSPILIGDRWDCVIELAEQHRKNNKDF